MHQHLEPFAEIRSLKPLSILYALSGLPIKLEARIKPEASLTI